MRKYPHYARGYKDYIYFPGPGSLYSKNPFINFQIYPLLAFMSVSWVPLYFGFWVFKWDLWKDRKEKAFKKQSAVNLLL